MIRSRAAVLTDVSILTVMTAVACAAFFAWGRSLAGPPLQLAVAEEAGQLQIAWNPAASAGRALLEIQDGANRLTIPLAGALANVCYAPATRNVAVRLVGWTDHFEARLEVPRLFVPPAPSVAEIRSRFDRTESELRTLQASMDQGRRRVAALERSTDQLSSTLTRRTKPPAKPVVQRFWRD